MKKEIKYLVVLFVLIVFFVLITPYLMNQYYSFQAGNAVSQVLESTNFNTFGLPICELTPEFDSSQNSLLISAKNSIWNAIDWLPQNAHSFLVLGRINCLLGDYLGAIKSFSTYIELNPLSPLGFLESGFAYEKNGEIENAVHYWNTIDNIDYQFLEVGKEYEREKNYNEAINWFDRALLINSGKNEPWYRMFLVNQEIGNYDEGLKILLKGLKESKEINGLSNVYYQIAWVLQYIQTPSNIDGAWEAYSKALAINNFSFNTLQKAASYSNRGFLLLQQTKTDEAIEQFETAIQLEPTFYWAHLGLARALWKVEQFGEAKLQAYYSITLSSKPADAYIALGDFYREEDNIMLAKEMYEEAIKINPELIHSLNALEELGIKP